MSGPRAAAALFCLCSAGVLSAQFRPEPCVNEPGIGPGFASRVESEVKSEPGGGLLYRWRAEILPGSKRTVFLVAFLAPGISLEPMRGWEVTRPPSGPSVPPETIPAIASVANGATETSDIAFGRKKEFVAHSRGLPGVGLLRLYPRRPTPCMPATEEEKVALERNGWTRERIGESLTAMTLMDFNTVREIILVPAFQPGPRLPKAEALFATALHDLGALEDYLATPLDPSTPVPSAPWPSRELQRSVDPSLEALRRNAILRKNFREKDRSVIERLYHFYATYD